MIGSPRTHSPQQESLVARDLVCLSHLRWDFVYQRPNHLMERAARDRRVFFVEEPVHEPDASPRVRRTLRGRVVVVTPVLPEGLDPATTNQILESLLQRFVRAEAIVRPVLWFVTPMAVPWTRRIEASAVVFDSMDYLAGFRGAPPGLVDLENELIARADVVFTGGASLHGRMRGRHPNSHCFPSSVDLAHFAQARRRCADPADQAVIPRPRIGYAGVIDERIDVELIDGVAAALPRVSIVLVGPIAKIDPATIPARPNIHQLGLKRYEDLPDYLSGWDVGWMPFARNDATRYISPTKTPEYLAAGLPVVSTSIHDVVHPYGESELVAIADDVAASVDAVQAAIDGTRPSPAAVDAFLARTSWDRTWAAMADIVD